MRSCTVYSVHIWHGSRSSVAHTVAELKKLQPLIIDDALRPRCRKGLDRASITVPKALITWLTEEAAAWIACLFSLWGVSPGPAARLSKAVWRLMSEFTLLVFCLLSSWELSHISVRWPWPWCKDTMSCVIPDRAQCTCTPIAWYRLFPKSNLSPDQANVLPMSQFQSACWLYVVSWYLESFPSVCKLLSQPSGQPEWQKCCLNDLPRWQH